MMDLFLESDYAGMATPVYGMYMTALLKNFVDRFLPLATPHIRKGADGSFYHDGRLKQYPRQFFIANSGFPGGGNFDLLKAVMERQGMVLEVYRNCGEILQGTEEDSGELEERLLEYRTVLREAGYEMVSVGRISEETRCKLGMELLSDEEYMAGANQHWDSEISQAGSEE